VLLEHGQALVDAGALRGDVPHDVDQRPDGGGVLADEGDVRLDVGAQHRDMAVGGCDACLHERVGDLLDLGDARGEQVVLAREVVADHAGARQARVLRDLAERRLGVADVGYYLDRRRHDLSPPGRLGEGSCLHEQNLAHSSKSGKPAACGGGWTAVRAPGP